MTGIYMLIAAVALAGGEILSGELTLLMLAGGALAGSGAAFLGAPLWLAVAVACAVSLLMLVFVKPLIRKQLRTQPTLDISYRELIGEDAVVLENTDFTGGQIRLDGSIWSARPQFRGQAFRQGDIVQVVDIDGTTAVVIPKELPY